MWAVQGMLTDTQLNYIKNVNYIEEEIIKTRHNIKTKKQFLVLK